MANYNNIDKQTLDLIKYPPLHPPVVVYGTDYSYPSNNLRGKLWQFCYRYKYDSKMKSVFSPWSQLLIPQGEELPNGDFLPNFHLNNYISIRMELGHFTVDELEVAYRVGNNGNLYVFDRIKKTGTVNFTGRLWKDSNKVDMVGNWGGIQIEDMREGMIIDSPATGLPLNIDGLHVISVDVPNKTIYLNDHATTYTSMSTYNLLGAATIDETYVYSIFRNNKVVEAVSEREENESFDAVPLKAGAMEVVESNRIVAADLTTGFPNLEPSIELTVQKQEQTSYLSKFDFEKDFHYEVSGVDKIYIRFPDTLVDKDYLYMNFVFLNRLTALEETVSVGYYYNASTTDTIEDIVTYFINAINEKNNIAEVTTDPTKDYNFLVRTLLTEASLGLTASYNSDVSYLQGAIVSYERRFYISKVGNSHTPSDNTQWSYFCEVAETDRAIILRSEPLGSSATTYNFQLKSYGASIYKSSVIYPIFKFGNKVNVGIEYTDYAGRPTSVQHNINMNVEIPYLQESDSHNGITNSLLLKIKHIPPVTAYSYRILIDRNVPYFFQFFFNGKENTMPDITTDNIHLHINVNRAIQKLHDLLPKSNLDAYIFEKGDRIRMIAYQSNEIIYANNVWRVFNDVMDVEIIGYDYPEETETFTTYKKDGKDDYVLDANGNKVRDVSTGYIITENFGKSNIHFENATHVLYEIYRPSKVGGDNSLYFQTHKTFDIGNPGEINRYHKGNVNQDPDNPTTTPAQVTIDCGNVYRKMRYSGEADVYFPVESAGLSDFYESDSISIGRTNVISKDLGQVHEQEAYVWSDTLLEGSNINGLNKFSPLNKAKLQSKHGAISRLQEKGFILYAFQGIKVTSIYIGRQSIINPDGTETIKLLTDAVFGTVNPSSTEYGCVNPESVSVSPQYVYFWDRNHSCWCRVAYNGIVAVSDNGCRVRFSELNTISKPSSIRRAVSVYDNKHDELITSHRHYDGVDYTKSIVGQYAIGDNKITAIGRAGGDYISTIEEGMILTGLTSAETTPDIDLVVLKVDIPNRIIYLDRTIPFDVGVTGPVEITALILKKFNLQTLYFDETANGFKSGLSFNFDYGIAFGDELLTFINGRTYLHDSALVPYNNFYGIQFDQYITFPWNLETGMIKLFNGLEYIANKAWGAIAKGDITVRSFDVTGLDMESRLPIARFKNIEGKFVSEFLRDMNTPGNTDENYALINGRFLRGQACIIKLSTFETVKTTLYEVSIYFEPSL